MFISLEYGNSVAKMVLEEVSAPTKKHAICCHGVYARVLTSAGFRGHSAPRLTWELRQVVLTQHDMVRNAWIFERG